VVEPPVSTLGWVGEDGQGGQRGEAALCCYLPAPLRVALRHRRSHAV